MTHALNDTLSAPRGQIRSSSFSKPYWDATRDKRLLIQRCKASGQYQFYPRPVSIVTGRGDDLEWCEVDGGGEVHSFSTTVRGFQQFQGHEPYLVIIVRLDVGVDIVSNLVGRRLEEVAIGMRVQPYWHPLADGAHLLMFQAAEKA